MLFLISKLLLSTLTSFLTTLLIVSLFYFHHMLRTRSFEVCYKTISIAYHVCSLSAALRLVSITHSSTRMLHLISIRPPIH